MIKKGKLFEINVDNIGLYWLLVTHTNSLYGPLVRVFEKSDSIDGIDNKYFKLGSNLNDAKLLGSVFFPVYTASKRGIVKYAGTVQIPDALINFPLFRNGIVDQKSGRVSQWWVWDGQTSEIWTGKEADILELPRERAVNDTKLFELIKEWHDGNFDA